ncbi:MAG: ComEC/Rec2 family competence protein [Planctomycetes bacterium]|nr:ComEC/Rec2 family competence protein [Planctomycetota bacterium]
MSSRSLWACSRWREHLDRRAAQLADPRAGALAQAFLLGDSRALDPEVADLFTRNGLRHVLAVSGWHVAMMALWIVRPFATPGEFAENAGLGGNRCRC